MITTIQDNLPKFVTEITDANDGSSIVIDNVKTKIIEVNSQATVQITEAIPISFIAATSLIAFKLITTNEFGLANYANADNLNHTQRVIGIAVTSAATGSSVTVKRSGIISNSGWAWTAKQFLYLGISGDITPNQVGLICVPIGYAINATEISLNIQTGIIRS